MNNYILGVALIVLLAFALFNPPTAKADHSDSGWGITITIPGGNYRSDDRGRYDGCWQIQRNYDTARRHGNWRKANYWERRWYDNGCNSRRDYRQSQNYYDGNHNYRRHDRHDRRYDRRENRRDHRDHRRDRRGHDN